MADVGLYVKNANIQARAGINANATAKATAATDIYVLDVENYINAELNFKVTAAIYTAMDAYTKYLLMDVGANICAMYVISADMSGFTSKAEAQTMLDFLAWRIDAGLKLLRQKAITGSLMGLE